MLGLIVLDSLLPRLLLFSPLNNKAILHKGKANNVQIITYFSSLLLNSI